MNKTLFLSKGYIVIRNSISKSLISKMQNSFTFDTKRKYSYNKSYEKLLNNYKKKGKVIIILLKNFMKFQFLKNIIKIFFCLKKFSENFVHY